MKPSSETKLKFLLQRCLEKDRRAQKELYNEYGPTMNMVCKRYLYDSSKCEEIMNRGFFKVFTKIDSFNNQGSFEGWVRRIMVNECLNENKRHKISYRLDDYEDSQFMMVSPDAENTANVEHILRVIDALPIGYKTVFNMLEIEGFSYKEVSDYLKISEAGCRSQLSRAKKLLRKKLNNINF